MISRDSMEEDKTQAVFLENTRHSKFRKYLAKKEKQIKKLKNES